MGVAQLIDLRSARRESGVYLRVLKTLLLKEQLKELHLQTIRYMTGPLIFGMSEDPVAVARF